VNPELETLITELDTRRTAPGLTSWRHRFEARAYAETQPPRPTPELLARSDGMALLYRGHVNEIHGVPEAGKGFIVAVAVAEELDAGRRVLYLDFDQDPEGVVERVLAAGAAPDSLDLLDLHPIDEPLPITIQGNIRYLTDDAEDVLVSLTDSASLVVLDGVNAGLSMHGMSAKDERDYADFTRLFAFRFKREGATVILIDHVTKSAEGRGVFAFGTIHKSAVLDGASYAVQVIDQPSPGRVGRLSLEVAKDRRGGVRATAVRTANKDIAAEIVIDDTGERTVIRVEPPASSSQWRPTFYMQKVSIALEGCSEPVTQNRIEEEVPGKARYVREALIALVEDGYVRRTDGPNRSRLHESIKPYREPES